MFDIGTFDERSFDQTTFEPPLWLTTDAIDNGLLAFSLANKIALCSQRPLSYADVATYIIGSYNFGIGNAFSGPSPEAPNGRKVTSTAVGSGMGTVSVNGTPAYWAVIDDANSRLLATGGMTGAEPITIVDGFALSSFNIHVPLAVGG
jgi:hypothetical protein